MLLDTLDVFDRGWAAVLRGEAWNAERNEGVYVHKDVDANVDVNMEGNEGSSANGDGEWDVDMRSLGTPVSLTERTRLRSLLVAGTERLEEWLESMREEETVPSTNDASHTDSDTASDKNTDLESAVERLGLEQAFNGLFERTLSEMGELGGEVLNVEGEVVMS